MNKGDNMWGLIALITAAIIGKGISDALSDNSDSAESDYTNTPDKITDDTMRDYLVWNVLVSCDEWLKEYCDQYVHYHSRNTMHQLTDLNKYISPHSQAITNEVQEEVNRIYSRADSSFYHANQSAAYKVVDEIADGYKYVFSCDYDTKSYARELREEFNKITRYEKEDEDE